MKMTMAIIMAGALWAIPMQFSNNNGNNGMVVTMANGVFKINLKQISDNTPWVILRQC